MTIKQEVIKLVSKYSTVDLDDPDVLYVFTPLALANMLKEVCADEREKCAASLDDMSVYFSEAATLINAQDFLRAKLKEGKL